MKTLSQGFWSSDTSRFLTDTKRQCYLLEAMIRERLSTDLGTSGQCHSAGGHLGMAWLGPTSDGLEDTAGFWCPGAGRTDALRPSCW